MLKRLLLIPLMLFSTLLIAQDDGYTLNAGDTIRIYVYGEPELTFENLLIGQNGRVAYPFLGELRVAGRTAEALQQRIEQGLLDHPRSKVDFGGSELPTPVSALAHMGASGHERSEQASP